MLCPKCKKEIDDLISECPFCHTYIKTNEGQRKKLSDKRRGQLTDKRRKKDKNKTIRVRAVPDGTEIKRGLGKRGLKLVIVGGIAAVFIILIIVIVMAITASKGLRYAEDASVYIGEQPQTLNVRTGIQYLDESKFYGVNSAVTFDYIYESEKSVKVQGIEYPAWAVTLSVSDNGGHISRVTYTDFSVLKHDIRGKKLDGCIDLDRFASGTKQSAVMKEIDLSPYSITYSEDGGVTYVYKYYYKRDNGDEQAMLTRVTFSDKGKYKYSTNEVLIPKNM